MAQAPHYLRVARAIAMLPALTGPIAIVVAMEGSACSSEVSGPGLPPDAQDDQAVTGEGAGVDHPPYDGVVVGVQPMDSSPIEGGGGVMIPPDAADAGDGGPLMPPELPA